VPDQLAVHAAANPDKLAVVEDPPGGPQVQWTFAALDRKVNQLCHLLSDLGLAPGGTLAWCGPNSAEMIAASHAAQKLRLTGVPLNYRLSAPEAGYVLDNADATVVLVDAEIAAMITTAREWAPRLEHIVALRSADVELPAGVLDGDRLVAGLPDHEAGIDTAVEASTMIYTSGTTGRPKGALRRGAGDPAQVGGLLALLGLGREDVHVTTGPLYHSGPGAFAGVAHVLGQTIVCQRRFDPEDWLRLVSTWKASTTFSAPTPIRMVCALPESVKQRYDRSSMRVMVANAAPWSMALKRAYLADFPPESLFEVYGSTELGIDTVLLPEDQLRKPGSCGKPAPLVELRLYGEDGRQIVEPGRPGELYVRSAATFATYHKAHDRFVEGERDGFHTVGDIAYFDDEGFYYICDRRADMIITGGMNVYPAEVEAALEEHPDVYEVAVFGIPDDEWGERVHAAVVARPGSPVAETGPQSLAAFARRRLASYKVPRSWSLLDELPRTGSGKVLKRQLRAPFWEGRDRQVS